MKPTLTYSWAARAFINAKLGTSGLLKHLGDVIQADLSTAYTTEAIACYFSSVIVNIPSGIITVDFAMNSYPLFSQLTEQAVRCKIFMSVKAVWVWTTYGDCL